MANNIMKVELFKTEGMSLIAKSDSGHWTVMDAPKESGGHGAATKPIELLLMSLAGCTSMDVISILKKKRINFTDFKVEAITQRGEEYPKVFKSISIHFKVYGSKIKEKDVARAIELSSEKYCAISAMLKKAVPISTSYEIIEV